MVSLNVPSLFDLCGIRFINLMWTRQDVTQYTRWCSEHVLFEELIDTVSTDVQNFPLPEKVKSRLWKYLAPVGKHLLSVLNVWLSKAKPESSQKWLTGEMLFDCLVLNADGLINQRETAKKLLGSRMLNDVFAFRLACINFLETEVLKLWPLVKLYFLNKILLESENLTEGDIVFRAKCYAMAKDHIFMDAFFDGINEVDMDSDCFQSLSYTTEPYEVLLCITYCFSKEKAASSTELLHYMGISGGWYEVSRQESALFRNVACYEYFCSEKIKYNHIEMIGELFKIEDGDPNQSCFIFHFNQLHLQQKAELFELFPKAVVTRFLQWPLSFTFLENTQEVWNLIPNEHKHWVFLKIIAILYPRYCKILSNRQFFGFESILSHRHLDKIPGIHCNEHLKSIYIALWKISLDTFKLPVLNEYIFAIIFFYGRATPFNKNFETSGLKEKLFHIFLKNGEAIFDLFTKGNIKESLRSLVAKYMPENFEDLDRRCISFIGSEPYGYESDMPFYKPRVASKYNFRPVNCQFVSFIQKYLFSANNIDKTFFINKLIHLQANLL